MIPLWAVLTNKISLAVYAILLGFSALITFLRARTSSRRPTIGRLIGSILFTLATMSMCTFSIGLSLFILLIRLGPHALTGAGDPVLAVLFGPAVCAFFAIIPSLYAAWWLCRLFWPPVAGPPIADKNVAL